jgi:hypothetical protein
MDMVLEQFGRLLRPKPSTLRSAQSTEEIMCTSSCEAALEPDLRSNKFSKISIWGKEVYIYITWF